MSLTRREALAIAAGGALASSCKLPAVLAAPETVAPVTTGQSDQAHLIGQVGFGHSTESIAEVEGLGRDAWLSRQLAAPIGEPLTLQARLSRLDIVHLSSWELRDWPESSVVAQLQQHAILRAVESPWQLRERMVDFWTNHFNVYAKKGMAAYRKALDERAVVRPNALGSFVSMLEASASSAAMLVYLDQQASTSAHPNENYARELLELHTLGVDGGYTQRDVMEVARCFTGWTEERRFLRARGAFRYDPDLHDDGEKYVLGTRIPAGGGIEDGRAVLSLVAKHPATAKNLARKMATFFLGSAEPVAVSRIRAAYARTDGDIAQMLAALFACDSFREGRPVLKRPFDYMVSALRASSSSTDGGAGIQSHLAAMGQPLYQWPMPDGYPVDAESWSAGLLARWNFALALAGNRIPGTRLGKMPSTATKAVSAILGASSETPRATAVIHAIPPHSAVQMATSIALCSPEFQYR